MKDDDANVGHGTKSTHCASMTNMIQVGTRAPDFTLETQFGTKFHLGDYAGQRNVLLLFYPLDWTPT